jgi:serine/threonine-protein phosphatase 2B regulatory subunit
MGASATLPAGADGLPQEEVDALCACTPLGPADIAAIRVKFISLAPDRGRLSPAQLRRLPELEANPLGSRLCEVFSGQGDGSLDFVELVDLYACMCKAAPIDVKLSVAFRLYDVDGDGFIGREDVQRVLEAIAGAPGVYQHALVTVDEARSIVSRVLAEGDFDGNEKISPTEFSKLLKRVPDFSAKFVMSIAPA